MRKTWGDPPEYRGMGPGLPQIALPRLVGVTRQLIIANAAVFAVLLISAKVVPSFGSSAYRLLSLDPPYWNAAFPFVPVWQLLTYGFVHSLSDPWHLVFNMLALYFFGTMLEEIVGGRRFLWHYLLALVLGGGVQLAWGLRTAATAPTVGASGGILFTIVAAAVLRPQTRVIFVFVPLTLRTMAMVLVGVDLFFLFVGGGSTAYLVHLSGAAYGFWTARSGWIQREPLESWRLRRARVAERQEQSDGERLDELLSKIHREGMHSLTRREKDFLKRVSSRR